MIKGLHEAIMNRSRLRNKILRDRTESSQKEYKTQINFCGILLKKVRRDHFVNLDVSSVLDNRKFWKNSNLFSQTNLKLRQLSN